MEAELNEVQEAKNEPVDKGWYSYFLWVNWLVTYATLRQDPIQVLIASVAYALITFYVACRSKSLQFCLKMLPGVLLSMFLALKGFELIGGVAFGIALIAALYSNRKRFKMYGKYKPFMAFYGFLLLMWIGFVGIPFISLMLGNIGQNVTYTTPRWVDITWSILTCLVLWWLFHREQTNGRRFWETMRILYLFPIVFAILLIDWATLIPIKFISGKSTLGDDEHDFLAWES